MIFQGAGSRWPAEITKPAHPAHALYHAVADKVAGVCGGCADVFGATEGAQATGVQLILDKEIPSLGGILDLSRYLDQGNRLIAF